jgi:hypothetical protein
MGEITLPITGLMASILIPVRGIGILILPPF